MFERGPAHITACDNVFVMKYEFLVESYETERVKVLSVWSEFKDEDLPVRPSPNAPRGRSVHERLGGAIRTRSISIVRISCIGGRTLAGHLLHAGLIDDVYLPTGRNTGGDPDTPLSSAPWRGRAIVRKRGTGVEQGVIFEHLLPNCAEY